MTTVFAFDRDSVRTYDKDGHLHVETANISKATVNPYVGREIPGYEKLGLDPDKIYNLLRDPAELERAAPSFAGKPLLIIHKPLDAKDHPFQKVIGAVGTDVRFEAPYLCASLTIWPGDAIKKIESGDQRELSCGYRYDPDMTPGKFEGETYDGVMRNILGNHVAIVEEGRAGPDVIIGDSKETLNMKPMTRKAALVHGAVVGFLQPKLAQDAKIDFAPVFAGVTAKNYDEKKPVISAAILKLVDGKLAQDASAEGLSALLDALAPMKPAEEAPAAATEPNAAAPMAKKKPPMMGTPGPDDEGEDADVGEVDPAVAKCKEFLASKLSPEDMAAFEQMISSMGAPPAPAADEDDDPMMDKAAKDKAAKDGEMPPITKPAMDAALAAQEKLVKAAVIREQRELREAEKAVRPYVGELAMSYDSAEQVYRAALKMRGVKEADTMHVDALKPVLALLPTAAQQARQVSSNGSSPIAMDSAATAADFHKRFPNIARIGVA